MKKANIILRSGEEYLGVQTVDNPCYLPQFYCFKIKNDVVLVPIDLIKEIAIYTEY